MATLQIVASVLNMKKNMIFP